MSIIETAQPSCPYMHALIKAYESLGYLTSDATFSRVDEPQPPDFFFCRPFTFPNRYATVNDVFPESTSFRNGSKPTDTSALELGACCRLDMYSVFFYFFASNMMIACQWTIGVDCRRTWTGRKGRTYEGSGIGLVGSRLEGKVVGVW